MINSDTIYKVLSNPAYNEVVVVSSKKPLEEKASPVALGKLRKRDLDTLSVSGSPLKNMQATSYGESPFSKKVISWKKENDITAGRNVAIVLFKHPDTEELDYTIATTEGPPGAPHAELKACDALPEKVRRTKKNILKIYTERKPCRHGSDCNRKLKLAIGDETDISFAAHHTPHKKRREKSEYELQSKQHKEGVRVANRKFVKQFQLDDK